MYPTLPSASACVTSAENGVKVVDFSIGSEIDNKLD